MAEQQNGNAARVLAIYGTLAIAAVGGAFYMGREQGEGTGTENTISFRLESVETDQDNIESRIDHIKERIRDLQSELRELEWRVEAQHGTGSK